jgi:hypothetical protein
MNPENGGVFIITSGKTISLCEETQLRKPSPLQDDDLSSRVLNITNRPQLIPNKHFSRPNCNAAKEEEGYNVIGVPSVPIQWDLEMGQVGGVGGVS